MSLNGTGKVTVAVDAMGGDHAPEEIVRGAVDAQEHGCKVALVGPIDVVRAELAKIGGSVPVVDAPDVIDMDESVTTAVHKEQSSLYVATQLVSSGEADAVVSCGNSAAIMAIALMGWGRQAGIHRPAFGGSLPTRDGEVFILDIGANTTTGPENLVQFAVMGDVYVRLARGIDDPRIALLSNGTEDTKGTKSVKEANEALRKLDLNFVGNVEGNQVFEGAADVVVTDGFTGNVLLKASEGVAVEIFNFLRSEISKDFVSRLAAGALMPVFRRIRRRVDFEEYGGVPVLGVNGIMINCHGRSRAKAVTNAVLLAERMAKERLVERIGEALQHEDVGARRRRLVRALHLRHE